MPVQINELQVKADGGDHSDAYLTVTTDKGKLNGEVESAPYVGYSRVTGWNFGAAASSAIGSGKTTGRRSYKNFIVTKRVDSASVGLLGTLARNGDVKEAKLEVCKSGGTPRVYYIVKLEAARVVDIDITMGLDGVVVESVVFAFKKVTVEYRPQLSDGSVGGTQTFDDVILPV